MHLNSIIGANTMVKPTASQKLVEMVTSQPGYTKFVGTHIVSVEEGNVCMQLARRPELLQFNGFFHGGVIAGLADHVAGAAVTTACPPGKIAVTIDLQVNFLKPADGSLVRATGRAVQAGQSVGVAQVEVMSGSDDDLELCAICTATMRIVPMPS